MTQICGREKAKCRKGSERHCACQGRRGGWRQRKKSSRLGSGVFRKSFTSFFGCIIRSPDKAGSLPKRAGQELLFPREGGFLLPPASALIAHECREMKSRFLIRTDHGRMISHDPEPTADNTLGHIAVLFSLWTQHKLPP